MRKSRNKEAEEKKKLERAIRGGKMSAGEQLEDTDGGQGGSS